MKVSELRIGNLLRDKVTKTELRVTKLTEQDIVTYVIDRSMFPLQDGWGIEPIPLTEERLLKFGFEDDRDNLMILRKGVFEFYFDKVDKDGISLYEKWDGNFLCNVEYVHEFQNLHFALTGEELKQQEQ